MDEAVSRDSATILLIDDQDMAVGQIARQPRKMVLADERMLARPGSEMVPLLVTSTNEVTVGTNFEDIEETAPAAHAVRIKLGGPLNSFLDPAFAKPVKGRGHKRLILAGLATDICLFHSALGALAAGCAAQVVAYACGSIAALADDVTFHRQRANFAVVTAAHLALIRPSTGFAKAEGQQAMPINLRQVMSKPGKEPSRPAAPEAKRAHSEAPLHAAKIARSTGISPAATKGFDPDIFTCYPRFQMIPPRPDVETHVPAGRRNRG